MDVRQLRYFEAVARHRHFTRAADELQIAQSALSHQVRGLERELGIELLQRTTRSVHLTEAGELVVTRARAVISEMEALRGEIDELRGLLRGHVTVGAHLFGGELDIPAILSHFTTRFPEIEITLREGTARRMVEMLDDGSLDVTFALEAEPPSDLERLELSSEELAAAMSPRHALAGEGPLPIAALQGQPLIAFHRGSSTRDVVDGALADARVSTADRARVQRLRARALARGARCRHRAPAALLPRAGRGRGSSCDRCHLRCACRWRCGGAAGGGSRPRRRPSSRSSRPSDRAARRPRGR